MSNPVTVHVFYTDSAYWGTLGRVKTIKVKPTETIEEAFTRYGGDVSAIVCSVIGGELEWNVGKAIQEN